MGLRKGHSNEALREVVERQPPRDLGGLLEQLRQGDADQRRWAARDLVDVPGSTAALGERLLTEAEPQVREAILTTLKAQASEAAAAALLPLLRSEDAGLRNGALESLSSMPEAVAPRIDALLRDDDDDVRIFTVNLLGELQHPRVPDWLMQVLQGEASVNVVAAAIEVLSEVGGPEHLRPLKDAVQRFPDDPFMAFAADMAAQRIEAP